MEGGGGAWCRGVDAQACLLCEQRFGLSFPHFVVSMLPDYPASLRHLLTLALSFIHHTQTLSHSHSHSHSFSLSCPAQVYDNCRMLAITGELLCYCDARKLHWYLDKGLAELVTEEPPTIRLLFEHKNADQQVRAGFRLVVCCRVARFSWAV